MGPSPRASCHPAVETVPWVFMVTAAENNHIWRALRGRFPGDPLDVCGTEFLGGREWWACLWLTGMSSWKAGDYSFVCVKTKYLEVTICQAVKMKINSQGTGEWRSTQWGGSDNGKEEGGSGRKVGRKNVERQKGLAEQGDEGEEETDDTGSLSQTLSDSSGCSIPRKLNCNPRWENLVCVCVGGEIPAFRRLVEEGKPHGKSPVQGLRLWQITTFRERNKQTKQKIMRNVLRIVFKVVDSISERTPAAQSVQVAQPHGAGGSWEDVAIPGLMKLEQSRRKLPATRKEWLVLVFLRRNRGNG